MHDRRRRFEQQVLPHLDAAWRYARWLARSPDRADDVVQEAVLHAFRGFDAFRGVDARAWLMTIVRHCHFTAWRREQRHGSPGAARPGEDSGALPVEHGDGARDVAGDEAGPEALLMRRDLGEALARLVAALPVEQREVLVLREVEDMDYRAIATVVGIPIGTVMSRLARARAALRRQWQQQEGPADALR